MILPLNVSEWQLTWQIYVLIVIDLLLFLLVVIVMVSQVDRTLLSRLSRELEFIYSIILGILILGTTAFIQWQSYSLDVKESQTLLAGITIASAHLCDLTMFMWLLVYDASPMRTRAPSLQASGLTLAILVAGIYCAVWGGFQGIGIVLTNFELSDAIKTAEQVRFQALIQLIIFVGKQSISVAFTRSLPLLKSRTHLVVVTKEQKLALKLSLNDEDERSIAVTHTLSNHCIRTRKFSKASVHARGSFTATRSAASKPSSPKQRACLSHLTFEYDSEGERSDDMCDREISRSRRGGRSLPHTPRRHRLQKVSTAPVNSHARTHVRSRSRDFGFDGGCVKSPFPFPRKGSNDNAFAMHPIHDEPELDDAPPAFQENVSRDIKQRASLSRGSGSHNTVTSSSGSASNISGPEVGLSLV